MQNIYETALVTREGELSAAALQQRIACICHRLQQKRVGPAASVLVYLSNEQDLLPAVRAAMLMRVHQVGVVRVEENSHVARMLDNGSFACILTGPGHAGLFDPQRVIVVDEAYEDIVTPLQQEHFDIDFSLYFYEKNFGSPHAISITGAELSDLFLRLDEQVKAVQTGGIFLSRCLPFSTLVTEMIWASLRGRMVVTDMLDDQMPLARYSAPGNAIEMRFSLFFFGSYAETGDKNKYQLLLDAARFADTHGFSAVWTPERHFNAFGGLYPNPSVLSAALAMITSNVQIRSGSLVSPLHHAVRIAEDWSLIDNLSNGRAGISFASGWQCDDFVFFPDNYAQRHQCMLQQIKTVQALWKGENISCKNGLGKEISISLFPKPVQQQLPLWITVSGKLETFVDAGKIGANILTHLLWQNSEELVEKIAAYRRSLQDNGFDHTSRTVSVMVHTYLGENNDAVKELVRQPLTEYIRSSTQLIQNMARSNSSLTNEVAGRYGDLNDEIPEDRMNELAAMAFQRFFEQASLLGEIPKAKKMIRQLKDYGADEVACLIDFGLNKADVLQGLHYLDRLRAAFTPDNKKTYPVTITHCSLQTLQRAEDNAELAAFLATQELLHSARGTNKTGLFNSVLEDEF